MLAGYCKICSQSIHACYSCDDRATCTLCIDPLRDPDYDCFPCLHKYYDYFGSCTLCEATISGCKDCNDNAICTECYDITRDPLKSKLFRLLWWITTYIDIY